MKTCHSTQIDRVIVPPVPDKLWHRIFLAEPCNMQFEPMTYVVNSRMPESSQRKTEQFTDDEISKLRDFLYLIAEIEVEHIQKLNNEERNALSLGKH